MAKRGRPRKSAAEDVVKKVEAIKTAKPSSAVAAIKGGMDAAAKLTIGEVNSIIAAVQILAAEQLGRRFAKLDEIMETLNG